MVGMRDMMCNAVAESEWHVSILWCGSFWCTSYCGYIHNDELRPVCTHTTTNIVLCV
jgi:hypothetical protein